MPAPCGECLRKRMSREGEPNAPDGGIEPRCDAALGPAPQRINCAYPQPILFCQSRGEMRELQQQAFATARDVLAVLGKYFLVETFSPRIAKRLAGGDVLRGFI